MQQSSVVRVLAALVTAVCLSFLAACGGGSSTTTPIPAKIVLFPTTVSLNEGDVTTISAIAQNSAGVTIVADITFTSSNPNIATISTGGSICGGVWDSSFIVCTPTIGQAGVGQVTVTASSGGVNATLQVYVHEKLDRLLVNPLSGCSSMGQVVDVSASAFSTSAPGCSPAAPCDITSTVGPITFTSNDLTIAASSSGIATEYSATTNSPTYSSGGTISGSAGQTCNLASFNGVTGATATVALTSKNTIASGARLTVTASGTGGTTPPTTATLSNGSATCSGTANVITALAPSSTLTAETPGATTLFASVSGLNSPGVQYMTCPVVSISVHSATTSDTSFTLTAGGTQALTADVYDSNDQYIKPPITWGSSSTAAATIAAIGTVNNPGTITAVAAGTAYITASCSDPACNKGLPPQYSLNLVTATVTGFTATTVYVASMNSTMLIPISTATDTAGTAITLPYAPNSMVASPSGTVLYLGSDSGLMVVSVGTSTVNTLGVTGTIEAISPDGNFLLLSDTVANSIRYFNLSTQATPFSQDGDTTTSSVYTPDSNMNEWLNGNQLGVGLSTNFVSAATLGYTGNALDISGQGGFTYVSSSAAHQVHVLATCNQADVQVPAFTVNAPTLIKAIPNGTGAVAADSPAIDVVSTGTVQAGCPATATNSIATFDLGAGAFNAQQIIVSPDGSNAWIIPDLPEVLNFNLATSTPSIIPLVGHATPYNGGITLDGTRIYVGANDFMVHRINAAGGGDAVQIPVGLKDGNGNPAIPNLVTVVP
jgi:Bacterial Ig-like domain (group 2)